MFTYKIIYSRRRTLSISVSPDKGVTVRAPLRTSLLTIEKFVASRSGWVVKHLDNYSRHTRLSSKIAEGEKVLFRGKEYTLRLIEAKKVSVIVSENEIFVSANASEKQLAFEKALKKWFYVEAVRIIPEKVNELISKYAGYGFKPSQITIRQMKRRWGSCSSKGRITLNSELIKIDDIFTEYVILHELCHLKHHNHGSSYYKLLGEVFPDWKNVRKELRKYLS